MARRKTKGTIKQSGLDYLHDDSKRKRIPPAGLAAQGKIREKPKITAKPEVEVADDHKPYACREGFN
jgi:hypothetical protein